eukprot:gene5583-5822_t
MAWQKRTASGTALLTAKVQVQISERDSKRTACCKSDGMRFAGADTTVKLRQDMDYILSVTVTPAVRVSVDQAELKHRQTDCQEPSVLLCCCPPKADQYQTMTQDSEWCEPVKVPISERTAASSGTKAVYEVSWNCNMDLTRSGVRGEVVLDIAVQDFGCITMPIMAKVYKHEDTSAAHGIPLHSITYTYGRSGLTGEVKLYSTSYNK